MDIFKSISNFFSSVFFQLFLRLLILFVVFLWLSLIYWTYRDAKKRGALAAYWAAVVFFFNVLGWLIYLVVRPPEYLEDAKERELEIKTKEALLVQESVTCPACLKPTEKDFLVCPYCLKKLRKSCPKCKRALQMSWTVCPYCKTSL